MKRFFVALLLVTTSFAQKKPAPTNAQSAHIQHFEHGLAPIPMGKGEQKQVDVLGLMKLFNVPGLSVTVFDDYKILWAKGYGVTEAGTNNPVTTHTLFQAGSISKPVAASATLHLVEQGRLSLDKNVNDELKSWKLPDNEFTKDQKVTLRRILSHTAGLNVHGFPGYAPADAAAHTAAEPIPTVQQVLDGEKPANTAPVRVELVPGAKYQYSGGGVTIEQFLVTETVGKPFPQIMRELTLSKIGMTESTYEQPLPPSKLSIAAVGTRADGTSVIGKRHIYPEMAAAGLWTTPSDLARYAIEIANSANGRSNKILSQKMTQQMLTPQIDDGDNRVGLGFFFNDKNDSHEFEHDGADEGFQAILMAYSDTGRGIAIMANSDNGIQAANYLVEAISKEYGWKFPTQQHSAFAVLQAIKNTKGLDAALDWFADYKNSGAKDLGYNEGTLNGIGYGILQSKNPNAATDAIKVFKLNTVLYPNGFNPYDSLAEAYMNHGDKELAIQNYEKSLELNPKNDNAVQQLKKLRGEK